MDEYIVLADETVVEDAYIVKLSDTDIAIYIHGVHAFLELYGLFGAVEKITHIHSFQYGDEKEWAGFTVLTSIQTDVGGDSVICLTKQTT